MLIIITCNWGQCCLFLLSLLSQKSDKTKNVSYTCKINPTTEMKKKKNTIVPPVIIDQVSQADNYELSILFFLWEFLKDGFTS